MDESTAEAVRDVSTTLVDRPPGEPRGRTPAMKERCAVMVKEPVVVPAAAGVAARMRDRSARAAATLGLT